MYEMVEFLHSAPYAICVELKYFYLFVFCFGGILFVSCVTVCGCGWGGEELGWVVLAVSYGCVCDGNIWGESGRAGCIRSVRKLNIIIIIKLCFSNVLHIFLHSVELCM